jgi:hypothetical protein
LYPAPWPTRPRYTIDATLDPAARTLNGTTDVVFTPDAPTDRIVFRLWANGALPGRAGAKIDITGSTLDGAGVTETSTPAGARPGGPGTVFTMTPPHGISAGTATRIHLDFSMILPGPTVDRISTNGTNLRLGSVFPVLSWVRGDGWQTSPSVDALAEAAATEVADWDVTVHAPPDLVVLATGDEAAAQEPGLRHFVASAVRDFAMTVGHLRVATARAQGGHTEVVAGVGEGATDDPASIARQTAAAVDAMAAHFGPYPYDRLTIAVTPGLRGGIEFPMHVQLGARISAKHLVHEVGHEWFYGLVGNDQYRDPWLDEGLTNYAEARIDNRLGADRALPIPPAGIGKTGESMAYWVSRQGAYFRSVYVGGTQALGVIADAVGGYGPLDCALARYVRQRAYSVARPSDLLAAIQEQTNVDPRPLVARFGIR